MLVRKPSCRFYLIAVCLFFLASLSGCKNSDLVCIGKAEEIQIGERFAPALLRQLGGEADDLPTQLLITRTGKTISDKCDRPDLPWEFYYVNTEVPNAATLPGGKVFVSRGLVSLLKGQDGKIDVDMLAGVMAHEISHAVARHGVKEIMNGRWADLAEAALDLVTRKDVTAQDAERLIRKTELLGYSRDFELQADKLGAVYATRSGYAKDGLARAGQILAKIEQSENDATPSYFRTHPYWAERLTALDKQLPTLNDEAVNKVVYKGDDHCKGWWGLMNLGVQYVRAKYILKSGAQIVLADSAGLGYPDTVIRVEAGNLKTYYRIDPKRQHGLWQVATAIDKSGKPLYRGVRGYSLEAAHVLRQQAIQLLAAGKTPDAIAMLNNAASLDAGYPETRLQLARAYAKAGSQNMAAAQYRAVIREDWKGEWESAATKALDDSTRIDGTTGSETDNVTKQPGADQPGHLADVSYVSGEPGIIVRWTGRLNVFCELWKPIESGYSSVGVGTVCVPGKSTSISCKPGHYAISLSGQLTKGSEGKDFSETGPVGFDHIPVEVTHNRTTIITPCLGRIVFHWSGQAAANEDLCFDLIRRVGADKYELLFRPALISARMKLVAFDVAPGDYSYLFNLGNRLPYQFQPPPNFSVSQGHRIDITPAVGQIEVVWRGQKEASVNLFTSKRQALCSITLYPGQSNIFPVAAGEYVVQFKGHTTISDIFELHKKDENSVLYGEVPVIVSVGQSIKVANP